MDPWHVQNIILHPRDKNGNLILSDKPRPESECSSTADYARKVLAMLDMPKWEMEKVFREWLCVQAEHKNKTMTSCVVTGVP